MKKLLSLVLALLMVLGCMSVTAFANTTPADTWSYDSTKKAFTINCTIPEMMVVGSNIPEQVEFTGSCSGVTAFGAAWGKVYVDNGFAYNGKKWNDPHYELENTFVAGGEYGYLIYISYQPYELGDLSGAKIVLNGKEYDVEVSIPYDKDDINESTSSQIFIAIDLGVLNENGSFSGGDFAEPEEDGKSGTTTLTATKAEPFSYKISIPTKVDAITAAGVYPVGEAAKAIDVKGATEKTVISYTATTTAFKLSTDESKTLAATYHSDAEGTTAFPTTAVTVYENKADAASLPTMYVKIADTDWNAAAAGTYTATVTFNFEAKETLEEPLADGYYLIFKDEDVSALNSSRNLAIADAGVGEYKLDWTFTEGASIYIVKVESEAIVGWYPSIDSMPYEIKAAQAGSKSVYFRPDGYDEWPSFWLIVK